MKLLLLTLPRFSKNTMTKLVPNLNTVKILCVITSLSAFCTVSYSLGRSRRTQLWRRRERRTRSLLALKKMSTTEDPSPPAKVSSGRSVKRPRVQKPNSKSAEHNTEMAKLSLLQKTLSGSDADSEERFGQQVASELRNINNPALQLRVKRKIMNVIYDAQETALSEQGSQCQFPGTQVRPPLYPIPP